MSIKNTSTWTCKRNNKYDIIAVGDNMFKEYRKAKKLTQEELAELAELDTRTIQRIENKEREPSIESFKKLIKALNIKDKDILDYLKK